MNIGLWKPSCSMQTDRQTYDEANSRCSHFCERTQKRTSKATAGYKSGERQFRFVCIPQANEVTACSTDLWQAVSYSVSRDIFVVSKNPKVHCRLHNRPHVFLVASQMNPFHAVESYSFKIHFDIFPSTPSSSRWSLSFRTSNRSCVRIFSHTFYMLHPSHRPKLTGQCKPLHLITKRIFSLIKRRTLAESVWI